MLVTIEFANSQVITKNRRHTRLVQSYTIVRRFIFMHFLFFSFSGAGGLADLETVLLKFMVLTPDFANKFYISEFDAVVSAMKKANKWKRETETKLGRSNDNSVNKAAKVEAESTCHTYRTLVECAGNVSHIFPCYFLH